MPNAPSFAVDTIGYVMLFVNDMARSVAFYRDTLGIPVRMESPEWTEFATKGTTLALHRTDEKAEPGARNTPSVVFSAEDIRATHATLRDRKVAVEDLKVVWESPEVVGLSGNFLDPDGNRLDIHGVVPKVEWAMGR